MKRGSARENEYDFNTPRRRRLCQFSIVIFKRNRSCSPRPGIKRARAFAGSRECNSQVDLYRPSPYEIIPRARARAGGLIASTFDPVSPARPLRSVPRCISMDRRARARAHACGCTSRGTSVSSMANAALLQGTCSRSNVDVAAARGCRKVETRNKGKKEAEDRHDASRGFLDSRRD